VNSFARAVAGVAVGLIAIGGALYLGMAPNASAPSSSTVVAQPPSPSGAGVSTKNPGLATPAATELVAGPRVVAWDMNGDIWVVNTDGTGARTIVPSFRTAFGTVYTRVIGWLPDGSSLIYRRGHGIGVADGRGELTAFESLCPEGASPDDALASCSAECCSLASIAPDGTRVAYAVWGPSPASGGADAVSAIAILDLATGRVTVLESTRSGQGVSIFSVSWSADGTRVEFRRSKGRPVAEGEPDYDVLSVGADGSDLQMVAPPDAPSLQAGPWSTWDGRIVSIRWTEPGYRRGDVWVTDADGGKATQLEPTIPALTAAGCMVCPFPAVEPDGAGRLVVPTAHPIADQFWVVTMHWQPSTARLP